MFLQFVGRHSNRTHVRNQWYSMSKQITRHVFTNSPKHSTMTFVNTSSTVPPLKNHKNHQTKSPVSSIQQKVVLPSTTTNSCLFQSTKRNISTTTTTTTTTTTANTTDESNMNYNDNGNAKQNVVVKNVGSNIEAKIGRNLYMIANHPIGIIKKKIEEYFLSKHKQADGTPLFKAFDGMSPIVTVEQNFDSLLFSDDHISRKPTDTYFFDANTLLRTHTTAHQVDLIKQGHKAFLISGDVYRRDDIDASHYPVFHQMDGVRIFTKEDHENSEMKDATFSEYVESQLRSDLEGLVKTLFNDCEMKWVDAYFPFTNPSMEIEVFFQERWLEVLGCGLIHPGIMKNVGYGDEKKYLGYAFGLGLERLAMVLFGIPDIRLFWTHDSRFLNQFKEGEIVKFTPYSKYPPCYKDIAFWITPNFNDNDFYELVREYGADLVESVTIVDHFVHPKTKRESKCYRINYRSMDRSLTNEEVDKIQHQLRESVPEKLSVTLR